jgi:hypothetical protein
MQRNISGYRQAMTQRVPGSIVHSVTGLSEEINAPVAWEIRREIQRKISGYRQAMTQRVPGSIVHSVTGLSEEINAPVA